MYEDDPNHPYYDPFMPEGLNFWYYFNRWAEYMASMARSYGYLR